MKKTIIFASIFFASQSFAKDTCSASWDLYMGKSPIGKMSDIITKSGNEVEITSSYIPSGLATLFNVKVVTRTVKFQSNKLLSRQEEIQNQSKKETLIWKKMGENNWEKSINNTVQDSAVISNSNLTIDSTSLPYLFQLDILEKKPNEQSVNVINKNKPYAGKISIDSTSDDKEKKLKVFFKTEKNTGTIYFNSNGEPLEMLFSDPKINFTAYIADNNCGKLNG